MLMLRLRWAAIGGKVQREEYPQLLMIPGMTTEPVSCPMCHSDKVEVMTTLPALFICKCLRCSAGFTIGSARPERSQPASHQTSE